MLPSVICLNIPQTSAYFFPATKTDRSRWPRGLSRCSAAAHLMELRVRIPPEFRCLSLVLYFDR